MNITIRDAQLEDLGRIVEIYNEAVVEGLCVEDAPVSVADKQAWFTATDPCLVYEVDKKIVGWVSLDPFAAAPVFAKSKSVSLFVSKESRWRGVGRCLITTIKDIAFTKRLKVFAPVWETNYNSCTFFKKVGFETEGELSFAGFRGEQSINLMFLRLQK